MHVRTPRPDAEVGSDEGGQGGAVTTGALAQPEPSPPVALVAPRWPEGAPFTATCVDTRHPTLAGRIKIRWSPPTDQTEGAAAREWWIPTLHGQTFRPGDRLLVQKPVGAEEPVALGVIDGFLPRPEAPRQAGPQVELKRDEALCVCTEDGQVLLEIVRDENGPVVRLLQSETRIEVAGKLSISASELELKARQGEVRIEASDDVHVIGEVVHLN